jgi:hypothetical protein
VKRREFLQASAGLALAAQAGRGQSGAATQRFVAVAESLKPQLRETVHKPISLVRPEPDSTAFLKWRMEKLGDPSDLAARTFRHGDSFLLDFGRHMTGHLAFSLSGVGEAVDSPVRLRLTFGEVPNDVAVPMDTYTGTLSRAWLPDEVINVDYLPQRVHMPRRYAFRYVKVDVIDTAPPYAARFADFEATACTSAGDRPPALPNSVPTLLRRIDEVSLDTLRDCMQTVFEDGPRRDRRLWIGDMRLQALTNYATYRNFNLVKRCLYLFAGLPREDGLVSACVYDQPKPLCGGQYIMDYAALYGAAVLDYVHATKDLTVARDLWPVVRRQMEIVGQYVNADGLFVDPGNWWLFIDWNDELDHITPMQGVLLYCLRQALELAKLAGAERDAAAYPERIRRMAAAARANFYDASRGLFVSGPKKQVSWASQAWMIHSGVATTEEGSAALRAVAALPDAVRPVTPYLYHYIVDAMLLCGMKQEARDLLQSYWGGMVQSGADTFWEIYKPSDPDLSPYKSLLVNSYCHAWSCTPAYFLRARGL